jgi:putative phosphoesterase
MKIGVISDTHLGRLTEEFEQIYERYLSDKDLILHAGDIISTVIVDFLSRKNFHGVYGNMDPQDVRDRLPEKRVIELGSYRLGLIHGGGPAAGLEDRVWSEFQDVDVIVYGHSHNAVNYMRDGVLVFNPGTATGFSSSGTHTVGILDLGDTIRGEIVIL